LLFKVLKASVNGLKVSMREHTLKQELKTLISILKEVDPITLSIINYFLENPLNAKELLIDIENELIIYQDIMRGLEALHEEGILLKEIKNEGYRILYRYKGEITVESTRIPKRLQRLLKTYLALSSKPPHKILRYFLKRD